MPSLNVNYHCSLNAHPQQVFPPADFRRAIQAGGEVFHVAQARRSLAQALLAAGGSRFGHAHSRRQITG